MAVLHWFRNDLRIHDNTALSSACASGRPVIACFIVCGKQWQDHDMAPIKANFLLRNAQTLGQDLRQKNIPLYTVAARDFSDVPSLLSKFMREHQCTALFFNREYAVNEQKRDQAVQDRLRQQHLSVHSYDDMAIVPVDRLRTKQNTPYTVFTPFKKAWLALSKTHCAPQNNTPSTADPPRNWPDTRPAELDWADVDSRSWQAGESAAYNLLQRFSINQLADYQAVRDIPIHATSQLSPYLAIGVLSPRECHRTALQAAADPTYSEGAEAWINELIWRDFYIHILYHFPRVSMHRAFKKQYDPLPWREDTEQFQAWCEGRTGIPLVDAAMRQLNQTGWMHNRLRMVSAMFLSKNLLIDWRWGERYFMRHLIDGFLPSNNGGWQWSSSTGTDAAPYFRIFNPVRQGQRFDPEGKFIRQYIPELNQRPNRVIHQPVYDNPAYPPPMVDLKSSRKKAIEWFKTNRAVN